MTQPELNLKQWNIINNLLNMAIAEAFREGYKVQDYQELVIKLGKYLIEEQGFD